MQLPPTQPQPAPSAPTRKPRNRRGRLILAMVAGVLALLCLGGAGVFISIYDKATEIKRSAPDAVVDNFLRAYLVNRDDKEVQLYACKSGADFTQLDAYRADIQAREKSYSFSIQVTWEGLRVATNDGEGNVEVDLTRAIQDGSEQITDTWRFAVVDQGGWRVCGAIKVT